MEVHNIGKLDRKIYGCITSDIRTEDVIITDNQIQHIKERHPNDYERFSIYFREIPNYKNSIITFMKIDEKEWNRLLKNKKVLYKRE